jgi:hypothetical protein
MIFPNAGYTVVGHAEQTDQAIFQAILTTYQMLSMNLRRGSRS